ncbi:MAG: DNA polymerase IV [Bacilli bacterium]|jgi:DNA polymerase-4
MAKVIVHIDLNQFFVRCEEIKNPNLVGRPVIVGGQGRAGIVSTCSYKARERGVHSGMPTYLALRSCPEAIVLPVDHKYYSLMSREFFVFLSHYSKILEKASVDECFMDVTDRLKNVKDVKKYFLDMQNGLFLKTGLKCSIGVAPTKFLAKMASDLHKPMGLTILHRRDFKKYIYILPVQNTFGIGKKTSPILIEHGIRTIGDLASRLNSDDEETKNILGKFFYVIKDWLNGLGSDVVDVEDWNPKSIGKSTTFLQDTDNFEEVGGMIRSLSNAVALNAKKENKKGTTVQLVVKDTSFRTHNKSISFKEPTNNPNTIYSRALSLYENSFTGLLIRLVGVTLQNLVDPKDIVVQMNLFENYSQQEEKSETRLLINELNRKLDKPLFKRASEVNKK